MAKEDILGLFSILLPKKSNKKFVKFKTFLTIESTIGIKIEDIEVFEVNSVAKAHIQIIIKRVISFLEDIKTLRFSPITCDRPEFCINF